MGRFSPFLQLPPEVQDLIWERSIPEPSRVAYHARLTCQFRHRNEDGSVGPNSKNRSHLHYVEPPQSANDECKNNATISTLSTLLTTCRRSSAVAIAAYHSHQPAHAFNLRGLRHPIDASSDLVIFQHGWQEPCRLLARGSARYLESPKPLRCVGVQWPGPNVDLPQDSWYIYPFNSIVNFLNTWADLAAFYVVVEPDHLHAARGRWLPEEERSWDTVSGDGEHSLERFLEAYRDAAVQGEALVFECGSREYFEVDTEQVAQSGGLEEVGELLRLAQEYLFQSDEGENEGAPQKSKPTRCMVMSWRPRDYI